MSYPREDIPLDLDDPSYDTTTSASSSSFTGWAMPHWGAKTPNGSQENGSLSNGAVAGIAIGAFVVLAVVLGVVVSLTRYKTRQRRESAATLVGDMEAEGEARKKHQMGAESPARMFRSLSSEEDIAYQQELGFEVHRTQRLDSAETYVEPVQPPIPMYSITPPRSHRTDHGGNEGIPGGDGEQGEGGTPK
ncbi:hypothetical protein DB88DRAFT_511340 [Papiliotrema laurentii]|uniref:Uncharacterized protein n=1 Tax=Papiliotrema laurentii TaxID=5418 RepID=A0AAD9D098_PAPLA|nr:hypothetical protein DB88DRAFT_511340 [Papiliotrema laurentii]